MIDVVSVPIEALDLGKHLHDPSCGGVCIFEGRVRTENEGQQVEKLEYESYREMALKQMEALRQEAFRRWPIRQAVLVHRIGEIPIGECAVWVGVASPHRAEAFEACRFLIDEIKLKVPIWKRETYSTGKQAWVAGIAGID